MLTAPERTIRAFTVSDNEMILTLSHTAYCNTATAVSSRYLLST